LEHVPPGDTVVARHERTLGSDSTGGTFTHRACFVFATACETRQLPRGCRRRPAATDPAMRKQPRELSD
jgi:hypothetical protein